MLLVLDFLETAKIFSVFSILLIRNPKQHLLGEK